MPGPMCYPEGGDQPTITDANLVLGRIPDALIGGGIRLDARRAREGIADLGRRLKSGMSVEQLAEGIIEIANWNQANCIRQMTIQRGIDPRGFALLSFGGSGPAQSPAVMELLRMKACIVPLNPGNLSAFGLLAVDWRTDHIATRVTQEDALDAAELARIYCQLEADALDTLRRDGIDAANVRVAREADVRYLGQSMEVRVPAPAGKIDGGFVAALLESFHSAHEKAFGYGYRGRQKVEVVNCCVSGFGVMDRPRLPKLPTGAADSARPRATRPVFFGGRFLDTPIYDRSAIAAGARLPGPAVVEEFGSTTVVFPGQQMTMDPHGIMVVERIGPDAGASQ